MKFRDFVNESSESEYIKLGQKAKNTDFNELREKLEAAYNIKLPLLESKNVDQLLKDFNKEVGSKYMDIFKLNPSGVGKGEILLASIHPKIKINGGGGSYDVDFGSSKLEVKAAKLSSDGMLFNYRFGVDTFDIRKKAYKEIINLYEVAKFYIPEIAIESMKDSVSRGELTALKKYLRSFDPTVASGYEKVDITIHKNGKIKFQDKTIASIEDKNAMNIIKDLVNANYTKIKSFDEIEETLVQELSNPKKVSYLFFNIKTMELYYKEDLSNSVIDTITQGSVKIRTPL